MTIFFIALLAAPAGRKTQVTGGVSIEQFGARANDPAFDNAPAIIKALNAARLVIFPPGKNYTILSTIQVNGLSGRTIMADQSSLINRNYEARTFLFTDCDSITINGGLYTRDVLPTVQDGKSQSTIGFKNCKNVGVYRVHIDRSPEMGIDNNIVIGGTYEANLIEHCLRDGIYAHYSARLSYIGNTLDQIKDDALSMHDYGIYAQKDALHKAGYNQAGYSVIKDNKISNAIQGISSIGCTELLIEGNQISHTANAGICVFNSENLYPGSTARVHEVKILNNMLISIGYTISVNTITVPNLALSASGRAAIFVGCNRQGQAFTTSVMRSSDVTVSHNVLRDCAVNAATLYNIDGLLMEGNVFTNCHSDTKNSPAATGNIVEILNCTKINVSGNAVVDTRTPPLHDRAYVIENSTGTFTQGITKGYRMQAVGHSN
jgi:hypothetical protein